MHDIAYNLKLYRTMLEEFDDFLLSKESFWPLGASANGTSFPRLSLGQVLMTRDELRVQAEEMEPEQIELFSDLDSRWEELRSEHPANLEKKALAESSQRLNLWRSYVQDLRESGQAASSYPTDVRQRALLSRLQTFISDEDELSKLQSKLDGLDGRLRPLFRAGSFVWHPRLSPLYDQQEYWFLYGEPIPQA